MKISILHENPQKYVNFVGKKFLQPKMPQKGPFSPPITAIFIILCPYKVKKMTSSKNVEILSFMLFVYCQKVFRKS